LVYDRKKTGVASICSYATDSTAKPKIVTIGDRSVIDLDQWFLSGSTPPQGGAINLHEGASQHGKFYE